MNILSRIFNKPKADENKILNSGLAFAMEFGKNYLEPIQKRLSKKYKFLNKEELDNYNSICKDAKDEGQEYIYNLLEKLSDENETIKETVLKEKLSNFLKEKYSWVNKSNLNKMFSQACYFAFKDGLDKPII